MKLAFSALLLAMAANAFAGYPGDYFPQWNWRHSARYENLNDFQRAGDPDAEQACTDFYQKVNHKRNQRVVVGIGYLDQMPDSTVRDLMARDAFVSKLTSACTKDVRTLCGFKQLPMKGAILLRKLVRDTHDYSQRSFDVVLIGGSMSTDNTLNTGVNKDAQLALCRQNENLYHAQIAAGADSVYYFGHSRNGGGPDFCPPVVKADGHVNYPYYQARREGIKGLTTALAAARTSGKAPSMVAMFSCSSQLHFKTRLAKAVPQAALLLSTESVGFDYIYRSLLTTISGQVNQNCREPFQFSLNLDESFNRRKLMQFYNFME